MCYLDLAEFIQDRGTQKHIALDLGQLFKRVVFNVMSGNRDDHLRNHGVLWGEDGWRLSSAFDMNPCIDKRQHVPTIDGLSADPDIELEASGFELALAHNEDGRVSFILSGALKPAEEAAAKIV